MGVTGAAPARDVALPVREVSKAASATEVAARATLRVPPASRPAAAPAAVPAAAEMERLRAQMDDLQNLLARSAKNHWHAQRSVPEVAEILARLDAAEMDPLLSQDIAARLEAAMATDAFFQYTGPDAEGAQNRWKSVKSDAARVENFLRAELASRVAVQPRLGSNGSLGVVAALVGPTGSGKTTSLAKLAIVASAQRPVRILSLDRSRPHAQELLKGAAAPAVQFTSVETLADLPQLVTEARKKECVLIDTPGFSAREDSAAAELAAMLQACGEVDVHMVSPAYMRARELRLSIERYRVFQPGKLLVTRLDESATLGTVFSEAARAGLALSFFSNGPRIPEDIRPATLEDLLAMVPALPRARAHHAA
jgi:flagellar biosynthesis protein FlhF